VIKETVLRRKTTFSFTDPTAVFAFWHDKCTILYELLEKAENKEEKMVWKFRKSINSNRNKYLLYFGENQ